MHFLRRDIFKYMVQKMHFNDYSFIRFVASIQNMLIDQTGSKKVDFMLRQCNNSQKRKVYEIFQEAWNFSNVYYSVLTLVLSR